VVPTQVLCLCLRRLLQPRRVTWLSSVQFITCFFLYAYKKDMLWIVLFCVCVFADCLLCIVKRVTRFIYKINRYGCMAYHGTLFCHHIRNSWYEAGRKVDDGGTKFNPKSSNIDPKWENRTKYNPWREAPPMGVFGYKGLYLITSGLHFVSSSLDFVPQWTSYQF